MVKNLVPFAILLFLSFSASAAGGKLRSLQVDSSSANWHVENPKVVFAFGLFEKPLLERYTQFAKGDFEAQLKAINPKIEVEVIGNANGELIVNALKDKNTIGFIFISHTFQTTATHTSVALTADGYPLPLDILSAATPSLRFAGIFGCHGTGIPRQYEVNYEFERLPGHHVFYYNEDRLLSANFMFVDNLKKLLKKELKSLEDFGTPGGLTGLTRGIVPDEQDDGTLRLRVKDVVPSVEPRFVYVNDRMVGVLGGSAETSNHDQAYEEFNYSVPAIAFQSQKNCTLIKISSSQLTPGAIVDDYLIESVALETPRGHLEKNYSPAWHLGESQSPPAPFETLQEKTHSSKKEKHKRFREELIRSTQAYTWMDRDPIIWDSSPLKGRFYIDCIKHD
jgi:hypothetical protein